LKVRIPILVRLYRFAFLYAFEYSGHNDNIVPSWPNGNANGNANGSVTGSVICSTWNNAHATGNATGTADSGYVPRGTIGGSYAAGYTDGGTGGAV
jgi:hypothetical protein